MTATAGYTNTSRTGSFTVVGGAFTTGAAFSIFWAATPQALQCVVTQNGGAAWYGLTATTSTSSVEVVATNSIAGATFQVVYSCLPTQQ